MPPTLTCIPRRYVSCLSSEVGGTPSTDIVVIRFLVIIDDNGESYHKTYMEEKGILNR